MVDNPENKKPETPKDNSQESPDEIDRLRRELYSREEPEEIAMRRKDISSLGRRKVKPGKNVKSAAAPRLADIAEMKTKKRKRILWGVGIAVLLIAVFVGAVFATGAFRQSRQVTEEQVGLSIAAPSEFSAGDTIEYVVEYGNNSRVGWENVEVAFETPSGFQFESSEPSLEQSGQVYTLQVGRLESGESDQFVVRGRLIGEQNETALAQAEITLTPENFPSGRFSHTAVVSTSIQALPIDVSIEAVPRVGAGERVQAILHVRNLSDQVVEGLRLKVEPAVGMELAVEDEQFSPDFSVLSSSWDLPPIEPLDEATRVVVLFLEGQAGESRSLGATISVVEDDKEFVQRQGSHVITITASELAVEQVFNGESGPLTVSAGEEIEGVIRYSNTGTTGLKNIVLRVQFEGEGIDESTIALENGAFDPTTNTITWTSSSVSDFALLQPNQSGELEYSFEMLETGGFPTEGENAANPTIVAMATIDSEDLINPSTGERKEVTARSVLSVLTDFTLEATAFYDDGRLGIESTGPIPPEVGQRTTYTVRLRAGSAFSDIGEPEVSVVLPDGIEYTGQTYLTSGEVSFDERTREVIWTMPLLSALKGRTAPAEELHFQVGTTPGENLRGDIVPFARSIAGTGLDLFVDETVETSVSSLPSTGTAARTQGEGQVQ